MGISDHLTCLLRNLYAGQEATEPYMEQLTGSQLGKECDKAVCCHPVDLTYMQCVHTQAKSLQSCSALCDVMDCSLPGSSVHGVLQARIILEWVAMPSSRASS